MKRKLLFLTLMLLCNSMLFAGYVTLTINSGLNADVIANGIGAATTSTTNDVDGVNYCLVSSDYQTTSSSTAPTYSLSTTGTINSVVSTTTGLSFQLASFSANNSLRIATNNVASALTFSTQDEATHVYVLATSGSGSCTVDFTINFGGGSSQAFTGIAVSDWYAGSGYAIQGIGRINRTTNALEGNSTDPRLYQLDLPISLANQSKLITGIEVTKASGLGILNIFAVSIDEAVVSCAVPTALSAGNVGTTTADLSWTENGTATQWQIEYGASGFTPGTGTLEYANANPYSVSGLSISTAYDFYVRAICGAADTSAWDGPFSFTTNCTAPNLLTTVPGSLCGPGIVSLSATADPGALLKWYANSSGGTPLATGNSFTTPSLTSTTTYYVAAASNPGTCESPRQGVTATINDFPVVNIGKDTTLCPGITLTLDATHSASTYKWNTGATSATIQTSATGTYFVTVTDINGCAGSDTVILTPGLQPVNNLPATMNLCAGSTIVLNAGNPGCSFDWNTTETTQNISVTSASNYSVDITSPDDCFLHSATQVIARVLPVVDLGNDTAICPNDAIVLNAGNPGNSFEWNDGTTTQSITTTDSGNYSVTVTNSYGCHSEDLMHLAFLTPPFVEGFNFIPLFYEELGKVSFSMLNPRDVVSCEWNFGDGSTVSTDPAPEHIYATGNYLVTLKVFNGCGTYSTSLLIHVNTTTGIVETLSRNGEISLYPNPARNQVVIENKTGLSAQQLSVFDALGRMVYKEEHVSNQEVLDVSDFAPGIYTVRLLTKKGWSMGRFEVIK